MQADVLGSAEGAALLARLDAVPALAARTDVSDLSGGLTNRNLKVTTPEGVFVARLSSPESALLAIDRTAEHANSVAAAASGAAPDVIASELKKRYTLQLVGRAQDIRQRFFAISVERKIKHPAVAAICEVARTKIFA